MKDSLDKIEINKVFEEVILKFTPGFRMLGNFKEIQNYFMMLHMSAEQYAFNCRVRGQLLDFHKFYNILNYDIQNFNEKKISTVLKKGNSKEYWNMYTKKRLNVNQQLAPFISIPQFKFVYAYILKIWVIINNSGNGKFCTRRTKDPVEIVISALSLGSSEGVCLFKEYNCYDCCIPPIDFLSEGGFCLFENKFNQVCQNGSKAHNDGSKIIFFTIQHLLKHYGQQSFYENFKHPFKNNTKVKIMNEIIKKDEIITAPYKPLYRYNNNNKSKKRKLKKKR